MGNDNVPLCFCGTLMILLMLNGRDGHQDGMVEWIGLVTSRRKMLMQSKLEAIGSTYLASRLR